MHTLEGLPFINDVINSTTPHAINYYKPSKTPIRAYNTLLQAITYMYKSHTP